MSEAKEPEDDRVDVLLLYHGSDLERQHFVDVTSMPNDGLPMPDDAVFKSFTGGIVNPKPKPGQIFKFKMKGSTIYYDAKRTSPERFAGLWRNTSEVCKWRATEEAREKHAAAGKALAKDAAAKYHLADLDDLREAYRKLPAPARAQLLAIIVRYLVA